MNSPQQLSSSYKSTIGLYHPHAHQRAGGEMVLWRLIHALNQTKTINCNLALFSNTVPLDFITQARKSMKSSELISNTVKTSETLSLKGNIDEHLSKTIEKVENLSKTFEKTENLSKTVEKVENLSKTVEKTHSNIDIDTMAPIEFLAYTTALSKSTTETILPKSKIKTPTTPTTPTKPLTISTPLTSTTSPIAPPAPVNPIEIPNMILDQVKSTFGIELHQQHTQKFIKNDENNEKNNENNFKNNKNNEENKNNINDLTFHFLSHTALSDSSNYPRFTLILQTFNAIFPLFFYYFSIVFYFDPISPSPLTNFPSFILDTSGYPIVSLLCWALGIPCGAYVHYPIIQKDMIERNLTGKSTFYEPEFDKNDENNKNGANNEKTISEKISKFRLILRYLKHIYFSFLCYFYTFLLSRNDFLLANGTWTYNHLLDLLGDKSIQIIPTPNTPPDNEKNIEKDQKNQKNQKKNIEKDQKSVQNDDEKGLTTPIINQELTELMSDQLKSTFTHTLLGRLYPPCNVPPPPSKKHREQQEKDEKNDKKTKNNNTSSPDPSSSPLSLIICPITEKVRNIYPIFVSLGQYRPEKQHLLMLDSFISLLQLRLNQGEPLEFNNFPLSLFFIGTFRPCDKDLIDNILKKINNTVIIRNKIRSMDPEEENNEKNYEKNNNENEKNIDNDKIKKIELKSHVKCFFNLDFKDLQYISGVSLGGLHAMVDEHFGIAVVELLANCYTIIGHKSAGPYLDIIVPSKIPKSITKITKIKEKTVEKEDQKNVQNKIIKNNKNGENDNNDNNDDTAVGYTASTCQEYTIMMNDILSLYQQDLIHSCSHHHSDSSLQLSSSSSPTTHTSNHSDLKSSPISNSQCSYTSSLIQMSLRGKERAYNEFSLSVFDQNVDRVLIPLLLPFLSPQITDDISPIENKKNQ